MRQQVDVASEIAQHPSAGAVDHRSRRSDLFHATKSRVAVGDPTRRRSKRRRLAQRIVVLQQGRAFGARHVDFKVSQHRGEQGEGHQHRPTEASQFLELTGAEVVGCRSATDENRVGGFGDQQVFPLVAFVGLGNPGKLLAIAERQVALPSQLMARRHSCGCQRKALCVGAEEGKSHARQPNLPPAPQQPGLLNLPDVVQSYNPSSALFAANRVEDRLWTRRQLSRLTLRIRL